MSWSHLYPLELSELAIVRDQFHQAVQSVAAVGRHFLEVSKEDQNAVLHWIPNPKRLAGKWIDTPKGKFRASISFSEGRIFLIDEKIRVIDSFEIHGNTFNQLMVWFEEHIGQLGLPVENFNVNLPYELPDYATEKKQEFDLSDMALSDAFAHFYANSRVILEKLKASFPGAGETTVWPHHFDQAISVMLKDSGNPETSSYLGLGMSPGDQFYNQPYFYVNSWPYAEEDQLQSLKFGKWHTDDWVGAVFTAEEIWETPNQPEAVMTFYQETSRQLQDLLLK